MALSMDEQRMLAEIERRLTAEDPGLAARMSSFRRPGPAARLRSPRGRFLGSLVAVAALAVVSIMFYAMIPFRAHSPRGLTSPQASVSGPANPVPGTSANVSNAARPGNPSTASVTRTGTAATGTAAAAGKSTGKVSARTSADKTGKATVSPASSPAAYAP